MYRNGFFTLIILVVMVNVIEIIEGKYKKNDYVLEFWTGYTDPYTKSATRNYVEIKESKHGNRNLRSKEVNANTSDKLESFVKELLKKKRAILLPDLEYMISSRKKRGKDSSYPRDRLDYAHGPRHRKTFHEMKNLVNRSARRRSSQDENNSSNETRKLNYPLSVLKESRLRRSNNSEENKDLIPMSPYNILRHLKEDVIPKFPDVNITVEVLGRTVEYNDIVLLKASATSKKYFRSEKTKYSDDVPEKRIIFIVHGLSVLGFTKLPCLYKTDSFVELLSYYYQHLDQFDIYLIPMANPDGVSMALAREIWNKNVSPQKACPGVALDRNFDVAWNETVDVSTCNQNYPGMSPFSEPESIAVRDTIHKYSNRIMAYFHVHVGASNTDTFKGDAVLYPRGYSEMQTDDDKYIDLKGEIEETLKNASFKVFTVSVDTLHNWYGKVAGTSVDYAATVYGIPYAMELVMQLYIDDTMVDNVQERETHSVLSEVWRRVIDTLLDNIYEVVVKSDDQ